jgi:hypothetical protein
VGWKSTKTHYPHSLKEHHVSRQLARFLVAIATVFSLTVSPLLAQTELGTALKRNYRLRSVACTACHLESENGAEDDEASHKSREALTGFGQVVAKLVEGKRVTERLDEVQDAERDAKKKVQDEIEAEFVAALKKLDEWKAPSGKAWAQAIRDGEVEGIKTRN